MDACDDKGNSVEETSSVFYTVLSDTVLQYLSKQGVDIDRCCAS